MFTLGNIAAVAATCFLVGPAKQFRNMSTKERAFSAAAFVGSMVLTLLASFYVRTDLLIRSDPQLACSRVPWRAEPDARIVAVLARDLCLACCPV